MKSGAMFLEGIKILDLTSFLSGPFCTQLLADMGAEVLKVEPPSGDSARHVPPHFVDGDSVYFHTVNRNKKSIVLNLKSAVDRREFLGLVSDCDVLVENFRPDVMGRLDLGLSSLRKDHPRLITCSISGFGANSPHSNIPAYDAVIQAWTGGMSLTGTPGGPPSRMGIPIGDLAAGMYGALGITGAIARRERSGEGEHIEVAMFDAQLALLGYQASYYLFSGDVPDRQGSGHMSIPTYRAFLCKNGEYVMVTANTEDMWKRLCNALGLQSLLADARFKTNADRLNNTQALWDVLEPTFGALGSDVVIDCLREAAVPVAPVNSIEQALADDQVAVRNMIVELESEQGSHVAIPGNPIKSLGMRCDSDFAFPPRLGEHNAERFGLPDEVDE